MRRLLLCLMLMFAAAAPAFAQATPDRQEEVEEGGRSGFWTSRRPAKGGAYRYRLMGIGVVILLVTGYGTLRLIKRTQPPKR